MTLILAKFLTNIHLELGGNDLIIFRNEICAICKCCICVCVQYVCWREHVYIYMCVCMSVVLGVCEHVHVYMH